MFDCGHDLPLAQQAKALGLSRSTVYSYIPMRRGFVYLAAVVDVFNVIDEFTRECLAIRIDRKLNSTAVIDVLSDLFILRGIPGHIRSDNGPEFIAKAVQDWIEGMMRHF